MARFNSLTSPFAYISCIQLPSSRKLPKSVYSLLHRFSSFNSRYHSSSKQNLHFWSTVTFVVGGLCPNCLISLFISPSIVWQVSSVVWCWQAGCFCRPKFIRIFMGIDRFGFYPLISLAIMGGFLSCILTSGFYLGSSSFLSSALSHCL